MPATVKVKIFEARHLPVMDRSGETTDAFVEVRLANNVFKTEVCRRTLDPKWDSDWFKFEVNDIELQEEPLQMRVMDYDTYSSHDAIGKVYVDLTNMLVSENRSTYAGWLPIYDTLLGIRGQLKIEVRLVPFCVDMRTLWHLSNSILFFSSALFPSGFRVKRIIGLVDHTLVADDPEHQWMDRIRTPRSTNEARQFLFMKMSGELRRKIGNKVVEFGGNAVLALRQRIDLGHMGVIFRAVGTAVVVEKLTSEMPNTDGTDTTTAIGGTISPANTKRKISTLETVPGSPVDGAAVPTLARVDDAHSADGERSPTALSEVGKMDFERPAKFYLGNSQESDPQESARLTMNPEFPFLTLKHLPAGLVKNIGGTVSCKMIKTLERLEQDDINQAPYAVWWKEMRAEIFRLMRCVGCNAVFGYSEELSLTDEGNIQLLCASGTAAVLDIDLTKERDGEGLESNWNAVMPRENLRKESSVLHYPEALGQTADCKIFHIPSGEYSDHVGPTSAVCGVCRVGHVPDILLTTIEVPDGTPLRGTGAFIQAKVQRKTKTLKGETGARELSETLPFLEFELHSQINTKLKLLGLNAVFNLKVDVQCGSEMVVACATCTGVCVVPLPKPLRPTITDGRKAGLETVDLQAKLDGLMEQQMRLLGLADEKDDVKAGKPARTSRAPNVKKKKTGGSRQYSKSGFVIDLEDEGFEGQDIFSLIDFLPPKDTLLFGSEICPMQDRTRSVRYSENLAGGASRFPASCVQNFCRVWRTRLVNDQDEMLDVASTFRHLLKDVVFRARMYRPCRICGLEFRMQISPDDELLLLLQGCIVTEPLPLYGVLKGTMEVKRIMRHAGSRAGLSGTEEGNEVVPPVRILTDETVPPETNNNNINLNNINSNNNNNLNNNINLNNSFNLNTNLNNNTNFNNNININLISPPALLAPKLPPSLSSRNRVNVFRQTQILTNFSQNVEISSLSFLHVGFVKRYVGNLNLVVLRECQTLRENEGLSGFMQRALADFYAIVRSQTTAAGGNAVLSFQIAQVQLADSYNQAQCIMHASGDMVEVEESLASGSVEP